MTFPPLGAVNETDRTVVDNPANKVSMWLRAGMVHNVRERQGNCASSRFEIGDPNTSLNETIRATLAAMWVAATCSPSVVDKNEPKMHGLLLLRTSQKKRSSINQKKHNFPYQICFLAFCQHDQTGPSGSPHFSEDKPWLRVPLLRKTLCAASQCSWPGFSRNLGRAGDECACRAKHTTAWRYKCNLMEVTFLGF